MIAIPEPTLDDLLADPIVQLVMRSDGVTRQVVRQIMEDARHALTPVRVPVRPCKSA